ncbi:hypothetical protein AAIB48_01745 [Paraclostridium benzoelyticum]|uniref:hypothetical protein n=1 Tax=Paraclostridium benzoelyticum TaxID=1629550 RepID=UPI0031CCDD1F
MKKEDRNIYISNIDLDDAMNMYFSKIKFDSINFEEIDVYDSLDRVTIEPVLQEIHHLIIIVQQWMESLLFQMKLWVLVK